MALHYSDGSLFQIQQKNHYSEGSLFPIEHKGFIIIFERFIIPHQTYGSFQRFITANRA